MEHERDSQYTIYEDDDHELKRLDDRHTEEYAIRVGGLWTEFTHVSRAEFVWTLHDECWVTYSSVRHSVGEDDIPDELNEILSRIAE